MNEIIIDVAIGNNENADLGLKPTIKYCPCRFDPNYLICYILYEENIGFLIGPSPFSCKKTEENLGKLKKAFDKKR